MCTRIPISMRLAIRLARFCTDAAIRVGRKQTLSGFGREGVGECDGVCAGMQLPNEHAAQSSRAPGGPGWGETREIGPAETKPSVTSRLRPLSTVQRLREDQFRLPLGGPCVAKLYRANPRSRERER